MKRYALLVAAVVGMAALNAVYAGPVLGPGTSVKTVEARGSVVYVESFRGGEVGVVSLVGDGSTDLDVFVYDDAGRLVAQGIGLTDIEVVTFVPAQTARFRIEVRNL